MTTQYYKNFLTPKLGATPPAITTWQQVGKTTYSLAEPEFFVDLYLGFGSGSDFSIDSVATQFTSPENSTITTVQWLVRSVSIKGSAIPLSYSVGVFGNTQQIIPETGLLEDVPNMSNLLLAVSTENPTQTGTAQEISKTGLSLAFVPATKFWLVFTDLVKVKDKYRITFFSSPKNSKVGLVRQRRFGSDTSANIWRNYGGQGNEGFATKVSGTLP